MRFTLGQLQAFVAIVDGGTFDAAARRLNVGQSTISKRISDLEASSQKSLFDRSNRRASLTPAGEAVYEQARDLVARAAAIEEVDASRLQKLRVRAGFTELASLTWLPRFLEKSIAESPELDYELTIGLSRDLMQMIEDGDLDIAVVPEMHFPRTVNQCKVAELEVALFARPGVIKRPVPVPIAELRDFNIIMQGSRSGYAARLTAWLQKNNLTKRPSVQIDSQHATLGLVVAGKGLCIAARNYPSTLVTAGKLEEIPTAPGLPEVDYFVVYKQSAREGFLESLARQIGREIDFDTPFF